MSTQSGKKEILLKTDHTWSGAKFPSLNLESPETTVLKILIEPGEKLQMHKHSMINICFVAKGTLTIICDDGQTITAQQGTSFAEVIDKFHYGYNQGNETVELIVFYIGKKDTPLSINQ